jgi:hypothetical protein
LGLDFGFGDCMDWGFGLGIRIKWGLGLGYLWAKCFLKNFSNIYTYIIKIGK